jgi:hypothetical protein
VALAVKDKAGAIADAPNFIFVPLEDKEADAAPAATASTYLVVPKYPSP